MTILAVALVLVSAGLHSSWNLIAHVQRLHSTLFLRGCLLIAAIGLVPVLLGEVVAPRFTPIVWGLVFLAARFVAISYFGLMGGYRSGHLSVVYPLTRALPLLLLAGIDVVRRAPAVGRGLAGHRVGRRRVPHDARGIGQKRKLHPVLECFIAMGAADRSRHIVLFNRGQNRRRANAGWRHVRRKIRRPGVVVRGTVSRPVAPLRPIIRVVQRSRSWLEVASGCGGV